MAQTRSIAGRPPRPAAARRSSKAFGILLALATTLVWLAALALVGGVFAYQYTYQGRIFPGVAVRGIDLSGKTLSQAEAQLKIAFDPYPLAPIIMRHGDQAWTLTAEDLGVNFDARSAAEAAFRVGRNRVDWPDLRSLDTSTLDQLPGFAAQVQANLQDQLNTYRFGHEVLAPETIDRTAGLIWLSERAEEIYQPVVEASLNIDGLDVSSSGSQVGRALDVASTHEAMYDALLDNQGRTVNLAVNETKPLLADVSQAEAFVRLALAGPVTLTAPEPDLDTGAPPPSYTISVEQLAPLVSVQTLQEADGTLDLKGSLDVEPLREQVAAWAADLARDPRDARLDFDPQAGTIDVLTPSQIGRALDVDAALAAIHQAALSAERQGTLPLRLVEPAVNMHRIEEMGIQELVAEGTTSFKGSSADRVHNIKTGAAAIHGKVIPPNALFSFNDTVGSVDSENGYKDSLIIWGDRTAVGIGGGICQVSTTVFRAAYYGGLPIEERYNHGYVVGWYGTPGLDATIYTPTVDFKFGNNTGHHLLVESVVDEAKGTLTFRFYGTKPDWNVEVAGPQITNEIAPGAATYQEDPSLAEGQIKQVEWSNKGMDVVWHRTITDGQGQVVRQDQLNSRYSPWSAYYLVGPSTPVPEGALFLPATSSTQSGG